MATRLLMGHSEDTPALAINDRIFLGEGLFETLKVQQGQPCFATLHWQRMSNSAALLNIPFDVPLTDWHEYLNQQIKLDHVVQGGLKVILSAGSAPRGLAEYGQHSQLAAQAFNCAVTAHPLRLISAPWRRDAANPLYQIKSVNYLEAILARRYALRQEMDDALFFNTQDHVTETTCANFFIVHNGSLVTPPQGDGVLPGITRARILQQCRTAALPYCESSITATMIAQADAVFTSNCLQGIRYVASLDNIVFALTHPLVERLLALLD